MKNSKERKYRAALTSKINSFRDAVNIPPIHERYPFLEGSLAADVQTLCQQFLATFASSAPDSIEELRRMECQHLLFILSSTAVLSPTECERVLLADLNWIIQEAPSVTFGWFHMKASSFLKRMQAIVHDHHLRTVQLNGRPTVIRDIAQNQLIAAVRLVEQEHATGVDPSQLTDPSSDLLRLQAVNAHLVHDVSVSRRQVFDAETRVQTLQETVAGLTRERDLARKNASEALRSERVAASRTLEHAKAETQHLQDELKKLQGAHKKIERDLERDRQEASESHNRMMALLQAEQATSRSVAASQEKVERALECPIGNVRIKQAVIAEDGITYERDAILQYISYKTRSHLPVESPMNPGIIISAEGLKPNYALQSVIDEIDRSVADSPSIHSVPSLSRV